MDLTVRPTGGVVNLMRKLPGFLRELEFARQGGPVGKAMVVRDCGGLEPDQAEGRMAAKVHGRRFGFHRGVKFHAVRRAMETWLLADVDAINSVAMERGGRRVSAVKGQLEEIVDPKKLLTQLLTSARLVYDKEVCRQIASRTRIETLRYRCLSFRSFETKVIDC
jgi:hypothetical protein